MTEQRPDDVMDADNAIERVYESYQPKMIALLQRIREVCNDAELIADEPYDLGDYRWSMSVWRSQAAKDARDEDGWVDVTVEIAESREYDGEDPFGINFGVDIVEYGGRILGGLSPYNYTPEVWVDARNEQAVADRWQIMEDADISEIPNLITKERA